MMSDGDYFLMMSLSRHWGIPFEELADRISPEELIRQRAFNDLCPIPDDWLINSKLMELVESLVRKPVPVAKRYPGEFFIMTEQPKSKSKGINRRAKMQAVAALMSDPRRQRINTPRPKHGGK